MTDYSQLPHLKPVAPSCEEPWLRWPSWKELPRKACCLLAILWSWLNAVLVSVFVWDRFASLWHYRRICGYGLSRYDLVMEVSPTLIAISLFIWASFAKEFPRRVWWVKLPALLAIVVWCGVAGGIQVGLPFPEPVSSIETLDEG